MDADSNGYANGDMGMGDILGDLRKESGIEDVQNVLGVQGM